jgi:hypothetical protein
MIDKILSRLILGLAGMAVVAAGASGAGPQTAEGHPDLNGFWKGTRDTVPGGNIAKDLPGLKLPLTPAGEAAWKHNTTATIDPESLCIIGGIPRHNASGLPFQVIQSPKYVAFLYFYSYYRLIPTDGRKHDEDPDPSFFGDEVGHWDGDTLVVDSTGFKETQVWADENGSPHSDALHLPFCRQRRRIEIPSRAIGPDGSGAESEMLDSGETLSTAAVSSTLNPPK